MPFVIENDIALAALGEQGYGLGAGLRHFVYVSIGTGIGMGDHRQRRAVPRRARRGR